MGRGSTRKVMLQALREQLAQTRVRVSVQGSPVDFVGCSEKVIYEEEFQTVSLEILPAVPVFEGLGVYHALYDVRNTLTTLPFFRMLSDYDQDCQLFLTVGRDYRENGTYMYYGTVLLSASEEIPIERLEAVRRELRLSRVEGVDTYVSAG